MAQDFSKQFVDMGEAAYGTVVGELGLVPFFVKNRDYCVLPRTGCYTLSNNPVEEFYENCKHRFAACF